MKITVRAKFNTSKQQIERYGEGKYLVYLTFPEDSSAASVIASLLSRAIGVPPHRIEFAGMDSLKNWVFEAS